MRVTVNGEDCETEATTLAALIASDYEEATVATAINGAFVPKRARAATPVRDGDRIEILAPRQGG